MTMPRNRLPRFRASLRALLAGGATLLLIACGGDEQQGEQAEQRTPVTVETVSRTSVDVEQDYAGRIHGSRTVEVRARVDGILEERLYREGQVIDRGASLFRIDPEPYEARLAQANAHLESAEADLEEAQRNWRRISRLYEQNAVSERERDTARSAVTLANAAVSVAASQAKLAQLDLDYTTVVAPVSGVTSLEAFPEGTLLERGTLLTTIVQHDPVHVRFAVPETDAAIQRAARRARTAAGDNEEHRLSATLVLPDGSTHEDDGTIDFTASTIDARTGTVTARAVFPNPDSQLIPGQFVRVRVLLETLDDVFSVPETIVSEGPEGPQVFIVTEDEQAEARAVELGPVVRGKQIILAGLEDGDRVVVNGHAALQPDMPVTVENDGDDD